MCQHHARSDRKRRIEFQAFPDGADLDLRDVDAAFPERKAIPPGPEELRFSLERIFIDPIPAQYHGLQQVLSKFPADVIIADNLLLGTLPMLLGPRSERTNVILCGTTFLFSHRDDGAPPCLGLPPATNGANRERYLARFRDVERIAFEPAGQHLNRCLAGLGVAPISANLFDAMVELPDAYLQLTVPSFEFPRYDLPDSVHFVGVPPIIQNQADIPAWAHELDGSRKVVLVTQGTVANHDFGRLVEPAMAALGQETDLPVVITCGGRPLDAVAGPIPSNVRMARYLPFEWLLPKVDVLVTNGGYGSVNQALSHGIPLVTAGLSEDKADVNARVAWSGVGVDLATNRPTSQELRVAVRTVLDEPRHRGRALSIAGEFRNIDFTSEVLRIARDISRFPGGAGPTRQVPASRAVDRISASVA